MKKIKGWKRVEKEKGALNTLSQRSRHLLSLSVTCTRTDIVNMRLSIWSPTIWVTVFVALGLFFVLRVDAKKNMLKKEVSSFFCLNIDIICLFGGHKWRKISINSERKHAI